VLHIAGDTTLPVRYLNLGGGFGIGCTPLGLLGDNVALPRAEIGDLLVLFRAGAYGLTASPASFLGHQAPAEVLV
jgi:diaminopimelate decarboxylase